MLRIWKWYQNCLSHHPVKTQVVSSGILWAIGVLGLNTSPIPPQRNFFNVIKKQSKNLKSIGKGQLSQACLDLALSDQLDTSGSLFFLFVPRLYEGLDRFIKSRLQLRPKSTKFVAAKVAMDGLIFGPFDLFVFFSYMGFSTGKSIHQVKEDVKRDFIPALILEGGIWPIVQVANFRYVPVRYQLLYVNVFCLLDSAFLSWIDQQKDAPWKQRFSSSTSIKERGGQGRL